jgi:succinoglycan biosynthesis protein ExoL
MTTKRTLKIAFFGHDSADAAIRRRVAAFQSDGLSVRGYMMQRRSTTDVAWDNVDLGETRDGAFLHRIRSVFSGASIAAHDSDELRAADLFYARNLDMLALAFLVKRKLKLDTPVVYESLDVHRLLSRRDLIGTAMRSIERHLLSRSAALIVSSPGFIEHHFGRYYPDRFKAHLVENRLAAGADYGARPAPGSRSTAQPLQVGWVGILRCKRSLDLLAQVADELGEQVHFHLHGLPARTEIPIFEPVIDQRPNMTYHGPYRSPEDLAAIYQSLDVVWAGDFMEAGQNSVWLLPNRIYEGGYYGVPSIAPAETQTAAWILKHEVGFTVSEPLESTLSKAIESLAKKRSQISKLENKLLSLPERVFIQPAGFLRSIIKDIVDDYRSRRDRDTG